MTIQQEEIRNVANIFEAFARAVAKRESIKIEYLNEVGEVENLIIETNKDSPVFSFNHCGLIDIKQNFVSVFCSCKCFKNFCNIVNFFVCHFVYFVCY